MSQSPVLALEEIVTGIPGTTYGEFDTSRLGALRGSLRAAHMILAPGGTTPLDAHEVRECWYVARGSGVLELDGRPQRLQPGQLVFFDSGQTHRLHNDGAAELVVLSLWWPGAAGPPVLTPC